MATFARTLRRGLPRIRGGEAWPPPQAGVAEDATAPSLESHESESSAAAASVPARRVRQGLPRVAGGPAWPPAPSMPEKPSKPAEARRLAVVDRTRPLVLPRTAWQGVAPRFSTAPQPEPRRIGPFTRLQWAGSLLIGGVGILFVAAMAVTGVRWLLSLEATAGFLAAYPGEYHLPEGAPVGIPAWLGWQHFFNMFLIVLIIRSGVQVRREQRPTAFWASRRHPDRKISLSLWLHQSLDILWLVNGLAFVVLLFTTGQWMKIVPTSWEVFPNALSAGLQYVSLDWPTENGWVNYNSLQQLAYFTTVFVAAPLAIITGVRMSGVWPRDAVKLNRIYPVEWARAVHFPVMLYFVVFIVIHVVLVLATGALRNLNHMFASTGSADPAAYADNWVGFWLFALSLAVIGAAWIAARPIVLAPIARLFGAVSSR